MTCRKLVFERMRFTDYRTLPANVILKPVRYRVEHAPGCNGTCIPEEVDVEERHYDIVPIRLQPRDKKWDLRMLHLASVVAGWSRDPSTKVGAVITRPDNTVLSMGFNGFPRGCSDAPQLYEDRERKYERIVHAELNAILTAPERPAGCTLYIYPPALPPGTCARCAAAVIQSGIKNVVHINTAESAFNERWRSSYQEAFYMYREADVYIRAHSVEEFNNYIKSLAVPGING